MKVMFVVCEPVASFGFLNFCELLVARSLVYAKQRAFTRKSMQYPFHS